MLFRSGVRERHVLLQEGSAWQVPAEYDLPHRQALRRPERRAGVGGVGQVGGAVHPPGAPGERGISHGDVVDLNRENIRGFDVREFYVKLAADLKRRGY